MEGSPAWTIECLTVIMRVAVKKTLTQAQVEVIKPNDRRLKGAGFKWMKTLSL